MTASEDAKKAGFKSLKQVSEIIGVTTETLRNWHKNDKKRFEVVLLGCLCYLDKHTGKLDGEKEGDNETV